MNDTLFTPGEMPDNPITDEDRIDDLLDDLSLEILSVIEDELENFDPVKQRYEKLRDEIIRPDPKRITDFEDYTKHLDASLNEFQDFAKSIQKQINELMTWWGIEEEELSENDFEDLRGDVNSLVDTLDSLCDFYEETKAIIPPDGCDPVQREFERIIQQLMVIASRCFFLMSTFLEDHKDAVTDNDDIEIGQDRKIYLNFGAHDLPIERVIKAYKTVLQKKQQSSSDSSIGKAFFSGALDLLILDMFIDF